MFSCLPRRKFISVTESSNRMARCFSEKLYLRPLTVAPLHFEFVFKKVFSDKVNMRCLLNDIILGTRNCSMKRIVTVHNIEVSEVTTTEVEGEDSTVLYNSCCTFIDGSMGSFKLLRTSNTDTIFQNVVDIAKLDYWQQWKTHNAFTYPVHIAVMENTLLSNYCIGASPRKQTIQLNLCHACPGLHYLPPPVNMSVFNLQTAKRTLSECTNDFERWCVIIRDSWLFDVHDLPALCRLQPFHRAVHMLDVQKLPLHDLVELLKVAKEKTERNRTKFLELILLLDDAPQDDGGIVV